LRTKLIHTLLRNFSDKFQKRLCVARSATCVICKKWVHMCADRVEIAGAAKRRYLPEPKSHTNCTHFFIFNAFSPTNFRNVKGCVICMFLWFSICSYLFYFQNYFKIKNKNNQIENQTDTHPFTQFFRQISKTALCGAKRHLRNL
jgi:hypothetical protein